MNEIQKLVESLIKFRDEREWSKFHDSKNLAVAISIEGAELNEIFLWKNVEQSENVDKEKIKEELADIFVYNLLLTDKLGLNMVDIVKDKMEKNAIKYPIEKAKGTAKKYDQL
jgi:NTP pyrophosphatase (non-canonical NTP hydrolase)